MYFCEKSSLSYVCDSLNTLFRMEYTMNRPPSAMNKEVIRRLRTVIYRGLASTVVSIGELYMDTPVEQ
jgi:hypothetical protein